MTTETDDLSYYEHDLPEIIAGVRRGEKWEFKTAECETWRESALLTALAASALCFNGRDDRNPLAQDLYSRYEPRPLPPNPLDEATRERIANEAIAKADRRQLRRLQRKQADRERNNHKEGGK